MRIEQKIEIAAPPAAVWAYVTDPGNYLHFMDGVTRWDVAGNRDRGLGARYRMLIHIGSADVGGLIEVVEWKPARNMAWSSVTGVDQRGRWMLREAGAGRTRVTFRFAYGVAGAGVMGLIAERVAARPLRRRFRQALLNLKRALEGQRFADEAEERERLAT
jgi:carbon monoxide dehydrogenase subunit G